MLLTYSTIKDVVPFERMASLCGAVGSLWERTGAPLEYGISWGEFLDQYQSECEPLIEDWLEQVSDKEILGWVRDQKTNLERLLKKTDALLAEYARDDIGTIGR